MVRFIGLHPLHTKHKKNNKGGNHHEEQEEVAPIYPNAADHDYFARKALDVVTAIASGFGLFSAMIFLVTMI